VLKVSKAYTQFNQAWSSW